MYELKLETLLQKLENRGIDVTKLNIIEERDCVLEFISSFRRLNTKYWSYKIV